MVKLYIRFELNTNDMRSLNPLKAKTLEQELIISGLEVLKSSTAANGVSNYVLVGRKEDKAKGPIGDLFEQIAYNLDIPYERRESYIK